MKREASVFLESFLCMYYDGSVKLVQTTRRREIINQRVRHLHYTAVVMT